MAPRVGLDVDENRVRRPLCVVCLACEGRDLRLYPALSSHTKPPINLGFYWSQYVWIIGGGIELHKPGSVTITASVAAALPATTPLPVTAAHWRLEHNVFLHQELDPAQRILISLYLGCTQVPRAIYFMAIWADEADELTQKFGRHCYS